MKKIENYDRASIRALLEEQRKELAECAQAGGNEAQLRLDHSDEIDEIILLAPEEKRQDVELLFVQEINAHCENMLKQIEQTNIKTEEEIVKQARFSEWGVALAIFVTMIFIILIFRG